MLIVSQSVVLAQSSHWRYSLAMGYAKPFSKLKTALPISEERLLINSPTGLSLQAALERSVHQNISIRASIGHLNTPYAFRASAPLRDTTGRIFGYAGGGGRSIGSLTVGTLGVTFNSSAYGRTIFTGGVDMVLRINNRPDVKGMKFGGRSSGTFTYQGTSQQYETVYEFDANAVNPLTAGLAFRLGVDNRISKRDILSVEASYTKGLGYVRHVTSTALQIDGVTNQGIYSGRASNLTVQIAYKHSLFTVNPLSRLQYTPYNQPQLNSRRLLTAEQRLATFRPRLWLTEFRVNYANRSSSRLMGAGLNGGYFFATQLMAGLTIDYQRVTDDYLPVPIADAAQVGPFIRAYAGRSKVAPYLEAGYQFGWFTNFQGKSQYLTSLPITVGLSARVSQTVRINASYVMRYYKPENQQIVYNMPQLSVAFSPER